MLRFVLASVPSLAFGMGEVSDVLHEELVRFVHPLLRVRQLRVEMRLDIQGVDHERITSA